MKRFIAIIMMLCVAFTCVACSPGVNDDGSGGGTQNPPTSQTEYVKVTFVQEEQNDVIRQVEKGKALTDVPTPTAKTGYEVSWDVTDFSNITTDLTVNAVYKAKTYKIFLTSDLEIIGEKVVEVKYNEIPQIPTPKNADGKPFKKWVLEDGTDFTLGVAYTIDGDLTIKALWNKESWLGPA